MEPSIVILTPTTSSEATVRTIICRAPDSNGPLEHNTTVRISHTACRLHLRIESAERLRITDRNFFYVPETSVLFFHTDDQWGAIDLKTTRLVCHKSAPWIPIIYRHGDAVIIQDDLTAWSCTLEGEIIDQVAIDPPSETIEFDDRIEYDSPVMGKQTLRLRR